MPTQIILLNFETGGKKFIEFNEYLRSLAMKFDSDKMESS